MKNIFISILMLIFFGSCAEKDFAKMEAEKYCGCIQPIVDVRLKMEVDSDEETKKALNQEQMQAAKLVAECIQGGDGTVFQEHRRKLAEGELKEYMQRFQELIKETCKDNAAVMGMK